MLFKKQFIILPNTFMFKTFLILSFFVFNVELVTGSYKLRRFSQKSTIILSRLKDAIITDVKNKHALEEISLVLEIKTLL